MNRGALLPGRPGVTSSTADATALLSPCGAAVSPFPSGRFSTLSRRTPLLKPDLTWVRLFFFLFAWVLPEAAQKDAAPVLRLNACVRARGNRDATVLPPFPGEKADFGVVARRLRQVQRFCVLETWDC
jgi:hypothetical protein